MPASVAGSQETVIPGAVLVKLSKTQMRKDALRRPLSSEGEPVRRVTPECFNQNHRVYAFLMNQTVHFHQGTTWGEYLFCSPEWIELFERSGIGVDLLRRQKIGYLANEVQAIKQLELRFSRQTLIGAGVLDPDGRFRFARHRILIPFLQGQQVNYLVGLDPEMGFAELMTPTRQWLVPYQISAPPKNLHPRRLYFTLEFRTGLRLGALGCQVWIIDGPQHLQGKRFEPLRNMDLIFCSDTPLPPEETIQPIRQVLEVKCGKFRWQTIHSVETEWILIQSRHERARSLQSHEKVSSSESPLLKKMVRGLRSLFIS